MGAGGEHPDDVCNGRRASEAERNVQKEEATSSLLVGCNTVQKGGSMMQSAFPVLASTTPWAPSFRLPFDSTLMSAPRTQGLFLRQR